MKTNNFIFVLFSAILILINSCSDDPSSAKDITSYNSKIKYIISCKTPDFAKPDTVEVIWDAYGRKISDYSISRTPPLGKEFKYESSKIIITVNWEVTTYDTLHLNDAGLVERAVYTDSIGNIGYVIYCYYNSNGYMTQEFSDSSDIHSLKYENENVIEEKWGDYTCTYEYYTDKYNTLGNINRGEEYYGKSSKNLLKREIDGDGIIIDFSYTFDSKNRVATRSDTSVDTSLCYYYKIIYMD